MKALILAGGNGKRLSASSNSHNKCMLQLFGKPLVQYSLENAVRAGVSSIVVVVGYRAEEIINDFGNRFQNVRIKYVIQHDAKGLRSCHRMCSGGDWGFGFHVVPGRRNFT